METHLRRYLNKIQLINLAISIFIMQLYRLPLINNMRTWHIRNTDSFSVTHTSVAELYQPFYQFRFAVLFIIDNQNISDIFRIHSHFPLSRKIRLIFPSRYFNDSFSICYKYRYLYLHNISIEIMLTDIFLSICPQVAHFPLYQDKDV